MNQHLVSIFSIVKNEKVFQFKSGAATFDEVQEVLEQFKQEFIELKKVREEEDAKKAEQEASSEQSPAVEPEVLNEQ